MLKTFFCLLEKNFISSWYIPHLTYTISYWIFEMVQGVKGIVNLEYASAVGIFFSAIALPIVLLVKRGLEKVTESVEY